MFFFAKILIEYTPKHHLRKGPPKPQNTLKVNLEEV